MHHDEREEGVAGQCVLQKPLYEPGNREEHHAHRYQCLVSPLPVIRVGRRPGCPERRIPEPPQRTTLVKGSISDNHACQRRCGDAVDNARPTVSCQRGQGGGIEDQSGQHQEEECCGNCPVEDAPVPLCIGLISVERQWAPPLLRSLVEYSGLTAVSLTHNDIRQGVFGL